MFESDYIMRMVKAVTAAIARVTGMREAGEHRKGLDEVEQAWDELLAIPPGLLDVIDAASLAMLLGDPEKRTAAIALLDAEADLLDAAGRDGSGRRKLAVGLRDLTG